MNNDITNILGIEDSDLIVHCNPASDCRQVIHIEKILVPHYCPECNFKMHSKGVYTRILNHPIRQGNIQVIFKVKQRRWRCTNPECDYVETDSFSFFERYRGNTNLADYLIVESFRDFNLSARQIAQRHHVSDTYALLTFAKYVDMKRLPLTSAICIDEVKLDISSKYKYVLIIQDFRTGEPIDMVIK